ncbi:MAG: tripartite tricarboxylate transporter TctB family protein [Methylobacteriaceae bacterium]|nr:tripartite tricarboxylate transporter TctB family protein [Methylobacteriaceae bacterium]
MRSAEDQRRGDIAFAAAICVIAAVATTLALGFPKDARMWPLFAVATLLVGAAGVGAQILARGRAAPGDEEEEELAFPARAAMFVGLVVVFDFLLVYLGFLTAGAFALMATPLLLGERRPAAIVATATVFLVVAYLVFNKLVHKALPPDWFWD